MNTSTIFTHNNNRIPKEHYSMPVTDDHIDLTPGQIDHAENIGLLTADEAHTLRNPEYTDEEINAIFEQTAAAHAAEEASKASTKEQMSLLLRLRKAMRHLADRLANWARSAPGKASGYIRNVTDSVRDSLSEHGLLGALKEGAKALLALIQRAIGFVGPKTTLALLVSTHTGRAILSWISGKVISGVAWVVDMLGKGLDMCGAPGAWVKAKIEYAALWVGLKTQGFRAKVYDAWTYVFDMDGWLMQSVRSWAVFRTIIKVGEALLPVWCKIPLRAVAIWFSMSPQAKKRIRDAFLTAWETIRSTKKTAERVAEETAKNAEHATNRAQRRAPQAPTAATA